MFARIKLRLSKLNSVGAIDISDRLLPNFYIELYMNKIEFIFFKNSG